MPDERALPRFNVVPVPGHGAEDVVVDALERDEARVTEAVEETVRFVPRPLRGRAKKMLFPEDR